MKRKKSFASLKAWRDELALNQRDAALVLGLSQSGYAKLEIGHRIPRPKKAKVISKKTGVPFENLMGVA